MVAVPVVPDVLIWARKERGLTIESASARLKITTEELTEIVNGGKQVSLGELENIATHYRIPLVSLLMPEAPPTIGRSLQDFRAFEGQPAAALSHETLLAISEASAFLEMLTDLKDFDPAHFGTCLVPPSRLSDNAAEIAKQEHERLKIGVGEQIIWNSDREAFLRWRELVEAQGVFTYQMKFGADDNRGVSMWDENEIPIIVIDSSEGSYQARVFTLWHEYAHVVLRTGGISNQNRRNAVERFCNSFAAHFLMPIDAFIREARTIGPKHGEWTDRHVA